MSVIQGVKAAGEIIGAHKDVIVKGAQVGTSEVLKKKSKDEAKVRYADYLAYKNGTEPDVEKFSYDRSQTTGRDWNTIMENIRFHMQKNGETEMRVVIPTIPTGAVLSDSASNEERELALKLLSLFPPALAEEYDGKSDIYKALAIAIDMLCR